MGFIKNLLMKYLPHDAIGGMDEDNRYEKTEKTYMRRYYLIGKPSSNKKKTEDKFQLRIHEIMMSDEGDLHDHPFNFTSIILYGGYEEETTKYPAEMIHNNPSLAQYTIKKKINPFSIVRRRAEDLHKLTLLREKAWTLVFVGSRIREWGFMTFAGWLHWKEHARLGKTRFVDPVKNSKYVD